MRFELHSHTNVIDGRSTPEEIVRAAVGRGLDGIAITDHDQVRGNLEARRFAPEGFTVIPGIELSAREGHIICLGSIDIPEDFLGVMKNPEKQKPASEIINLIHDIGGLAIAAHPYDLIRNGVGDLVYELEFDAIEVLNGHTLLNRKSPVKAAKKLGIPMVGGTDAHNAYEVGNVTVECGADILDEIRNDKVRIISASRAKLAADFMRSGILKSYFRLA
ncbi:MAG: CehA/McbA family metallohydrolase [Candidatus Altiarchaeota archaeon]